MHNTARNLIATSMLILLSAAALAAPAPSIKNLEDKANVTLSGTVDKVSDNHEFTLRNSTGAIKVHANSAAAFKKGDSVTVSGTVNSGLFRKKLEATSVMANTSASN